MDIFGQDAALSEVDLEKVLSQQNSKISKVDRGFRSPHPLEELHALAMKKTVPRKDGIPIEFYLALWDGIGPILLEVLQEGLRRHELHPQLATRIIILLVKRGDQLF